MSVVKVIEAIGGSSKSWEDAVNEALKKTAKTVRNIKAVDVINMTAKVEDGKISEYRANVKIAFVVE